ncbi:cysteine desulfurase NifS [Halanaerobium sp.]|jgi:cysteine desulfurase|uniref:cysteine desulfurase NifS n=1 Tax=Halanaerobium sp. TaxID=1895664 RepID=UPI000DE77E6D|nr:cysteine desulfurase NifS [Halanaerobium sp.]PUU95010.1 MAG: iscS2 [Halanaerobium sp.]
MRKVYFDNAATTRVKDEVIEEMQKYYSELYGNPSSIYNFGQLAKKAVEKSRVKVARLLNSNPDEIYFTGGGSEADNWAIKGILSANEKKGNHIITTKIEHHAILHTCEYLEKKGAEVTYLDVDENGLVDIKQLEESIKDNTVLISIMFANNEIGTVQPIKEIGEIAKKHDIYFHTDAVQAVGNEVIDVKDMNIDLLSLSAHKIHGPKGVGALYIKKGTRIHNLIHGGAQEKNKRAGTENVPGIAGLGRAADIAYNNFDQKREKLIKLRDRLIEKIDKEIPECQLNGHREKRLPGNVNFSFKYIEGESLLLYLDMEGISASSGSACTSGSLDPSHVLMSIGLPHEIAHGSLRLSLSDYNTEEDVDYTVEKLINVVKRLRQMSPLYSKREE